jgi:hypothetical protein
MCLQYLSRKNRGGNLPFAATSFGSWWGTDSKEKTQTDFDIVAANRGGKQIILGECKWKNRLNDVTEIQKLMSKEHLLSEYSDRYYCFFSKAPFSKSAKKLEGERLKLITADMLFAL